MKPQAPNWAIVINEIVATGMTELEIARHGGVALTLRAVRHLQSGVQPFFHRGECLVQLWCERTGRARAEIPMSDVLRGHRKARERRDSSPRLQELPVWPPAVQRADQQGPKQRAPRKAKAIA